MATSCDWSTKLGGNDSSEDDGCDGDGSKDGHGNLDGLPLGVSDGAKVGGPTEKSPTSQQMGCPKVISPVLSGITASIRCASCKAKSEKGVVAWMGQLVSVTTASPSCVSLKELHSLISTPILMDIWRVAKPSTVRPSRVQQKSLSKSTILRSQRISLAYQMHGRAPRWVRLHEEL